MSTSPRSSSGVLAASGEFAAAGAAYLRARISLLGIEAREAGARVGIAAGLVVGALFVVLLGYVLLVFAIIFAIAAWAGGEHAWIWTTLAAALVHFGLAGAALFLAVKKFKDPMFADSLDQLRKDQAWLNQKNNG